MPGTSCSAHRYKPCEAARLVGPAASVMLRGVSLSWQGRPEETGTSRELSTDHLPLRIGCLVGNGLQRDVVASLCLVLEKPLPVNILTTPRCLPILLFLILFSHPFEEVPTHEIVIKI